MTPERCRQIFAVFHDAMARGAEAREPFLDKVCAGDETLRAEVIALLEAHHDAGQFGERPVVELLHDTAGVGADLGTSDADIVPGIAEPGMTLGGYRIERPLGRGGMGVVYLAYDTTLHRRVALKLVGSPAGGETARARLLREARNAAALNHPNICTIHEVGDANGSAFIAMEYVDGRPLSDRLADGALPFEDAIRYAIQISDALAYAHDNGVIHRDLKAVNVMVRSTGSLKLVDFGLARRTDALIANASTIGSLAPAGVAAGTPYAMAPEQVRGAATDARTDLWAFGVLLYQMVSGATPFTAPTIPELFSSIMRDAPAPLAEGIPIAVRSVIERCLEKMPEFRYQHARDVRVALEGIEAGTTSRPEMGRGGMRPRRWMAAAAAGVAVVSLLAGANVSGVREWLNGGPAAAEPIKLAVLPFENLTGDPEQEYFSDGLTDEVISQLGRLRPQQLSVIARTSSMRYKNRDTPLDQIGRELGVGYVIEGSARREANRVRISTTLIDLRDQTQRWTETFERELDGILALQADIARGVARSLAVTLLPAEENRLAKVRRVNPEAYDAYLRGKSYLAAYTPDGFDRALASLQHAIELDPSEPLFHAALALAYGMSSHGPAGSIEAGQKAKIAALRALELDNSLGEVHEALALIRMYHDYDIAGAEESFRRALELNATLAAAHAHYAWLHTLHGRRDAALRESRLATEIDPFDVVWRAFLGWVHLWANQREEALAITLQALELNPNHPVALYVLGIIYVVQGRYDDAIAAHRKASAVTPEWGWGLGQAYALAGRREEARKIAADLAKRPTAWRTWGLAEIYTALGETDEAFRWLEAAYDQRNGWFPWIAQDPFFAPLRGDPRFEALLQRVNLPI